MFCFLEKNTLTSKMTNEINPIFFFIPIPPNLVICVGLSIVCHDLFVTICVKNPHI